MEKEQELQPKERRNRKRLSILLILVLLLLGTLLLYVARSWQIGYFQHLSTLCDTQSTLFCLSDADVSSWRTLAGFAIVGVSAGVTLLVNQVLQSLLAAAIDEDVETPPGRLLR